MTVNVLAARILLDVFKQKQMLIDVNMLAFSIFDYCMLDVTDSYLYPLS